MTCKTTDACTSMYLRNAGNRTGPSRPGLSLSPSLSLSAGECLRLGCPVRAGGGSGWAIALSCGEDGRESLVA
jgi:hypothetical protein